MRKLVPLFAVAVVAFLFYFFYEKRRDVSDVAADSISAPPVPSAVPSGAKTVASADPTPGSAPSSADGTADQAALSPEKIQLQNWIAAESKSMNETKVDPAQKERELKTFVSKMTPAQKQVVVETALDIKRAVNERILSVYMTMLDPSSDGVQNLTSLLQKPLPDFGPLNAHSEASLRHAQELSLKTMGLAELEKRAFAKDGGALAALKTLAQTAESAEVRGRAQQILDKLK